MNSLKNMTFNAKRKIDIEIRYVRDSLRKVLGNPAKSNKQKINGLEADQSNKENNMNLTNKDNRLGVIEVKLQEKEPYKSKVVIQSEPEEKRKLTLG